MAGDDVQLNREIAIATDAGDGAFMLLELRVSEELGRLFRIEAVVRAQRANINLDTLLGTNATARVTVKQGVERYFNGIISRISRSGEKNTELDYTIVIVPQIWLATRTTDCSIAQNLTVPAIVKQYLEHYDVVVDDQLKGTYRSWEYCVQYRESDFNFISRLMEQEGISYFFKHENGAHKMVLCDDPLSHKPIPNVPEVEFFPPNPDMPAPANTLSDWNFDADLESAGVALNDFDFKAPTKNLVTTRGVEVPGIAKNSSVFDHPGEYTEVADGEIQARVRAEEIAAHALGWSGSGTCRDIYAGGTFKLKDPREVLREADRGEYLVIASTLIAIQNLDESGSGGGGSVSCSLRAVKSDRPFRPNRSTPKPVIPGPQTAMVVGPDGQELQVDEFGRVRVRFMWDRYGTEKPEDSSAWIRVSQPWAGKSYGAMFIPRAGHEVIVEFLEGDPDRPIITGRVYNFDNKVPYALPANKTISTIRTDSSPHSGGYHEIRFEDKDGSEQLMIHAQRRMDLTVKASLYESAYGNREEIVGYEDKGDHNTTVCGDTNDHRKKGTFYKIEKVVNKTVVEDVVEDFQKTQTTKAADRLTLNSKEILLVGGDAVSIKGGKVMVQGSSGVHLKAGDICIEGTQSINLKVGGNFVVIDASGVSIKGTMVNINSGGSAKAAEGPLEAEDATIEEPFDAYAATTAVPGAASSWSGGGSSRSRTSRTVEIIDPPPPPPPPPPITPVDPGTDPNRRFIDIAWVEQEAWCGDNGTLTGHTENYPDGTNEAADVRAVVDGDTITTTSLTINGNSFTQGAGWRSGTTDAEVVDVLPKQTGGHYELFRDFNGHAGGQVTPDPLRIRFIPNVTKTHCSQGRFSVHTSFDLSATDYECLVESAIKYIKGWGREIIDLRNTVPATTGGVQPFNAYGKTNWRWAQLSATGTRQYWNGSAWVDVPATWADDGGLSLYGVGVWQNGTAYQTQFGGTWPTNLPDWNPASTTNATILNNWVSTINTRWSHQFDFRRDGCNSTDEHCCRYSCRFDVSFSQVTTKATDVIVLCEGSVRANAGLWPLGETNLSTMVHEFGHHLGNPDEYSGQQVPTYQDPSDGLVNGLDDDSVMGQNMTVVKKRHFGAVIDHLAKAVKDEFGKDYTYVCVDVI